MLGNNSNGDVLGSSTWNAPYNTKVSGSDKGSDTKVGAYYDNYIYTGCTSATVTTNGATVYRYFKINKKFKLPETGIKKNNWYLIGISLITCSFFLSKKYVRRRKKY